MNSDKICVFGLGYVGLPVLIALGKIFDVIGYDIQRSRVDELNGFSDKTLEIYPADLKEYLNDGNKFTDDLHEVAEFEPNTIIVTVPTPVDKYKVPDLSALIQASSDIGQFLSTGSLVIFESTVYPGATEEVCVPILEKISGLVLNQDFFVGYSPERINPGDRSKRFVSIPKVVSGSNKEALERVSTLYKCVINAEIYEAESIKVAEAAKVIENAQRDVNIAFVNELSLIFQRMGISTDEVLRAASTKWNFLDFRPGLVGGHCIGVDPYYLIYRSQSLGYAPEVIGAGRRINDFMHKAVADSIVRFFLDHNLVVSDSRIAVLGVSFKENCPDIRNSGALDLIRVLQSYGFEIIFDDPFVHQSEIPSDLDGVSKITLAEMEGVNCIIVAVGHDKFSNLNLDKLRQVCVKERPLLYDLKSIFKRHESASVGFEYMSL